MVMRGEGETLLKARQSASAELARQLSAEVRAQVVVEGVAKDGETTEKVTEQIEVSTHFKHGELIKSIKRCERCIGSECVSTVALNRDRAAQRLIKDLGPDHEQLSAAAQDLNMASSLLRFTQAWNQAQSAYQRMKPILNQLRVLGRMTPELAQADRVMQRAHQENARRHEHMWIAIEPLRLKNQSQVPQGLLEVVDGQLSQALESLKLKRWGHAKCPVSDSESKADVIKLTPHGSLSCTLGLIGPQCQLMLGIKVELCPQQQLTQVEWSTLKLVGVHPRDPKRALHKLNQSLQRSDLSGVLKQTLSPFIIF